MYRRRGNAVRKEEVEKMATEMHHYASMTIAEPPVEAPIKKEEVDAPVENEIKPSINHRAVTAVGFLAFLGLWYAFSPYLPQAVKQFLWAVQH